LPVRQRRGRDPDDQLGGEATHGVHALIADLDQPSDLLSDLYNTLLLGLNQAWDDSRASFVTMNSVVMAAALNEHTPKKTRKIVDRTPKAPPKDAQRIH
jgi:hypothetical protein